MGVSWKPRQNADVEVTSLNLSPLDGYVLSRLDGQLDLGALGQVTGLPAERLEEILLRLVGVGAVEPNEDGEDEPPGAEHDSPVLRERFETRLRALGVDERASLAAMASGEYVGALCFDPAAQVIRALLGNPRFGPSHARLVARHHRDATGLEALCAHAAFAADDVVRRELLKNPQLGAGVTRRLWGSRRPLELFKWSSSREVTEQTRRTLRELMRTRFSSGLAEERVEVIVKTEGRALASLAGLPVDSKTTALLCARTYASALLVQNVARWGAAPPALVAHLLKQPLVQRQPSLRSLLAAHPNAPKGH